MVTKWFAKILKELGLPRPLQHKFEIREEVSDSRKAENNLLTVEDETAPNDEEAPRNEEEHGPLCNKHSILQDDCFQRFKLKKVVKYIKDKIFLLMCDKPLIRTEVCLNIFKIHVG